MTGIELLDYIYIAGWVLRILAVAGIATCAVQIFRIARSK